MSKISIYNLKNVPFILTNVQQRNNYGTETLHGYIINECIKDTHVCASIAGIESPWKGGARLADCEETG